MSILSLKDLRAALPKGKRLLGIDQSRVVLGLALSTPDLSMATPLRALARTKFSHDVKTLAALCREYDVGGFVIGLPLHMNGSEGPRTDSVRHFADNLLAAKDVFGFEPLISFFDERLSTQAARDMLEGRDGPVDALAAQLILQDALKEMTALTP